jgi:hypothetical protein
MGRNHSSKLKLKMQNEKCKMQKNNNQSPRNKIQTITNNQETNTKQIPITITNYLKTVLNFEFGYCLVIVSCIL